MMQVLCKASNTASDVRCNVCGQGFVVYWERTNHTEREKTREKVLHALREQHENAANSAEAHPQDCFNLPAWNGEPQFSGAALLGNAPAWSL